MRPVQRNASPIQSDFTDYRDAFPYLVKRIGLFCSYCERRIPTNLSIEHIQPKGLPQYAALIGRWDNFLLGCVNCNSTKLNKNVYLDKLYIPDRDNTFAIFAYTADGHLELAAYLNATQKQIAADTLALTGLDKPFSQATDENGRLVAIDRVSQRMEAWGIAEESRSDLQIAPVEAVRRQIVRTALALGFFSIWMEVFAQDTDMRRRFIQEFPNTAQDCFDAKTQPVSPRPDNGLPHAGKI